MCSRSRYPGAKKSLLLGHLLKSNWTNSKGSGRLAGRRGKDLTGKRQTKGYLEAIEPTGSDSHTGVTWRCRCLLCGTGERNVFARDFTSNRVKKCEQCVRPHYKARQQSVVRVIKKRRSAKGQPFRSADPEFRRNWKTTLTGFSLRRRLLFETILNGRDDNKEFRFQALDWALSVTDLESELQQFSPGRIDAAKARLRLLGLGCGDVITVPLAVAA